MLIRHSCICTASRPGRSRGPRGKQPIREGVLPTRQLCPVPARTRRYRACLIAKSLWVRKGVPRRLDDALCAAGGVVEATVRANGERKEIRVIVQDTNAYLRHPF